MLNCHLEEDDPIPEFRDCDQCKNLYDVEDGFISLKGLDSECCSESCAESFDEEFEDD